MAADVLSVSYCLQRAKISNLLVVIVICRHVGDLGALRRKFCCADAGIVTRRSELRWREATKLHMQRGV